MSKRIQNHTLATGSFENTQSAERSTCDAMIPASLDDYAARIRNSPVIAAEAVPDVPGVVPKSPSDYAQRELRKLDAELRAEADRAIAELLRLGTDLLARDLGPAMSGLPDFEALHTRREALHRARVRLDALGSHVETQQRVADHDTILALESLGRAIAFFSRFDASLEARYAQTLAVLAKRSEKISLGVARARAEEPAEDGISST